MNKRIKKGDIYSINKPDDLTNTSLSLYSFYILIKIYAVSAVLRGSGVFCSKKQSIIDLP